MEKELYYKLEDNADMTCVCRSMEEISEIIKNDIPEVVLEEGDCLFYTITPVYLTEEEFEALPDSI